MNYIGSKLSLVEFLSNTIETGTGYSDEDNYIYNYNNEGLMSLDTIRKIISKYGKHSIYTQEYRRFKSDKDNNRNYTAKSTTEYLHCIKKY